MKDNVVWLSNWVLDILKYIVEGIGQFILVGIVMTYVFSGFGLLLMLMGLMDNPGTITYVLCVLNVIIWLVMIINDIKETVVDIPISILFLLYIPPHMI